jgi:hypothetical protein
MKLASVLLLAILLSCSYPVAQALEAGEIAEPSMPVPNMNMPTPIITKPNMDLPDQKSTLQSTPDINSSLALNQSGHTNEESTLTAKDEADAVSGKWIIKFEELRDRSLDLTLWSSGKDKIMGFGTQTIDGAETSMTASGSLAGEELVLVVKSAQVELGSPNYNQYDLDMFAANSTISGTYILSSGTETSVSGNATAIRR